MDAVLTKAASYILIIVAGYALKRIGLYQAHDYGTLKSLLFHVTLPAAVISSFASFERDMSLVFIAVFGVGLNLLMLGIGYLAEWKHSGREKAFLMLNLSGYNIGTFAMPYLQAFLGSMGTLVACIFDAGNAIMCTGLSFAVASSVIGEEKQGGKNKFFKNLFSSVPFDTYCVMLIMYICNIRFPDKIYTIASAFGGANAFIAMFMIGGAIEFNLKKEYLAAVGKALIIRFGVAAILSFTLFHLLPYSLDIRRILAILVFAPVSAMAVVFTERCGLDEGPAGVISSFSILISLVIMTSLVSVWKLGV